MLTDKTKNKILEMQGWYPDKRSALIPALHLAQSEVGYLPLEVQKEVAELFSLDISEVNSVVTFYDMLHEKSIGKHVLHVCKNISCMLRGGDEILSELCKKLNVKIGQKSEDGEFTLLASECLGACDRAPMMLVDEEVVGPIKCENLDSILNEAKKGKGHPSPVTHEEVSHA